MLFHLGLILLVLYLGALVAHRFRQSSVLVFILAGIALQFFVPHSDIMSFLAQMGAMLLLFTIGLDFSPERLQRSGRRMLIATALDAVINLPLGVLVGIALGFDLLSALVLGGVIYNNSTSIIARLIIDSRRSALPETEYAVGVSVFQDLITALYVAVLAGMMQTEGMQAWQVVLVFMKALGFFAGAFGAALLLRPLLHRLMAHESLEVFLFFVFSFMIVLAALAESLGMSAAIGVFFAGFILPERAFRERVERVIAPFRDLFAALFFVSFGLLMELEHVSAVLGMSAVIIGVALGGKLATGWAIGRLTQLSKRASLRLGVALIPRGEFSILLASLAPAPLLDLTVILVLVLALLGPVLMRWSE
uniref:Monovalent cation:H+ antiporter-2, CPA2 family n=1 Tax=Acetithermum autotrophicum TaxID=1446466 RepID=H5SRC8_ACEAU|nr:monovalent cation:H+ antiporter-2, CPA2 family [Candidatus Acetothermum autotrophicum]